MLTRTASLAGRRAFVAGRRAFIAVALAVLPLSGAGAESFGISKMGMTCDDGTCHGSAAQDVTVMITGPATLITGQTADYTASISGAGTEQQLGAGINAAVTAGSLFVPAQTNTIVVDGDTGEIRHGKNTTPAWLDDPDGALGVFSYAFQVVAPQTEGSFFLDVAMNAFNGDTLESGDNWNTGSLEITVPEPGASLSVICVLLTVGALRRRGPHARR